MQKATSAKEGKASGRKNPKAARGESRKKRDIEITASKKSAAEKERTTFVQLVDECEFAKYAPSAANSNLKEVYEKSVELISNLEEQLK